MQTFRPNSAPGGLYTNEKIAGIGVTSCWGATAALPVSGSRGFAPGCTFLDILTGTSYQNTGTFTSATFTSITTSGLPAISGIPLGNGAGTYTAAVSNTDFGSPTGLVGVSKMAPRMATIVIAASDSQSKSGADYVCTGTADHTTINTALAAAPLNSTIFFRDGSYYCQGAITAIRAGQHLMGESIPCFSAWGGGYGAFDALGSGAKLIFDAGSINGITFSALRNVNLERLYIANTTAAHTAFRYDGSGIVAAGDRCNVRNCQISGWFRPMDWSVDSSFISDCSINNNGYALSTYYNGTVIERCIFYNVNGPALFLGHGTTGASIVRNNQFAMFTTAGIWCQTARSQLQDNQIFAPTDAAASGILIGNWTGGGAGAVTGCVVTGNVIQMSNFQDGSAGTDNTSGHGISVGGADDSNAVNGCVINNNVLDNSGGSNSTGYAINFINSSTNNIAMGNRISGTRWRSGVVQTILWGTGNFGSGLNSGDA